VQYPLAEQIALRRAIALPLREFLCRDPAFDLPVAVGQHEGGLHRRLLALQAASEAHEFWHPTRLAVHQPSVEVEAARSRIIWRNHWIKAKTVSKAFS
jgi:hypothetical protein